MDGGAWWAAVHGVAKSRTRLSDFFDFSLSCIGEGNGKPLQYSCLENPVDGGAWWAAVHRVAQSQTRLKWISMHACIGEGNGKPFQYSCLENPRDRGAWWAAVYGVTQSRTWLKRLSNSISSSSMVVLVLIFWRFFILFPRVGAQLNFPTFSAQVFPFFHILANACYLLTFWY